MRSLLLLAAAAVAAGVAVRGAERAVADSAAALDANLIVDAGVTDEANEYRCTVDFTTANPGDERDLTSLTGAGERAATCNVLSVTFHGKPHPDDPARPNLYDALPSFEHLPVADEVLELVGGVLLGADVLRAEVEELFALNKLGAHGVCATGENAASVVAAGCRTSTWAPGSQLVVQFDEKIEAAYIKLGSLGLFPPLKDASQAIDEALRTFIFGLLGVLGGSLGGSIGGSMPGGFDNVEAFGIGGFLALVFNLFSPGAAHEIDLLFSGLRGSQVCFTAVATAATEGEADVVVGRACETTRKVVDEFQVAAVADGKAFDKLIIENGAAGSRDGFCLIAVDQLCDEDAESACAARPESNPPRNSHLCECFGILLPPIPIINPVPTVEPTCATRAQVENLCVRVTDCAQCQLPFSVPGIFGLSGFGKGDPFDIGTAGCIIGAGDNGGRYCCHFPDGDLVIEQCDDTDVDECCAGIGPDDLSPGLSAEFGLM